MGENVERISNFVNDLYCGGTTEGNLIIIFCFKRAQRIVYLGIYLEFVGVGFGHDLVINWYHHH